MSTTRLAGPVSLSTTAAEVYVPSGASIVTGIHVTNRSASPRSFSLFLSQSMDAAEALEPLTVDGTEFFALQRVSQGKDFEWQGELPMGSGEALVAVADGDTLTIIVVGS